MKLLNLIEIYVCLQKIIEINTNLIIIYIYF